MMWDSLPDGWEVKQLGEVCESRERRDPTKTPDLSFKYVDISSVDNNLLKIVGHKDYLGREAPSRARKVVRTNDVIFATTRPYLRSITMVPAEYDDQICSTGFCVLRATEVVEPRWIFYCVRSKGFMDQVLPLMRGSSYPAVTDKDVLSATIPFPPLDDQRRIVARIEELTERIDAARCLRAEAVEEAAAILPTALAEVFGEAEGKGWKVKPMGEVGYWTSGGTPSRSRREYFDGSIPWVKTGDLNDDYLNQTEETISEEGLKNSSAKLFPKGTLLVAMYGATVGKLAILDIEAATNQACAALQVNSDLLANKWAFYYILSIRNHLRELSKGGAQPNISQTVLKAQKMPLPPLDEQRCIVEYLDAVQAKVETIRRYQEETRVEIEAMTGAVLERAFRGEL